jgi:hypothetical protein
MSEQTVTLDREEYFELMYRQRDLELAVKEAELHIGALSNKKRVCLERLAGKYEFDPSKQWRFDEATCTLTLVE